MEHKLDSLIKEFSEFQERYQNDQLKDAETLGKMHHELSELNSAVRGNERNDQPGLLGRVKEVETDVRHIKRQQYRIMTWVLTIGAGLNLLWIAIKELFTK